MKKLNYDKIIAEIKKIRKTEYINSDDGFSKEVHAAMLKIDAKFPGLEENTFFSKVFSTLREKRRRMQKLGDDCVLVLSARTNEGASHWSKKKLDSGSYESLVPIAEKTDPVHGIVEIRTRDSRFHWCDTELLWSSDFAKLTTNEKYDLLENYRYYRHPYDHHMLTQHMLLSGEMGAPVGKIAGRRLPVA